MKVYWKTENRQKLMMLFLAGFALGIVMINLLREGIYELGIFDEKILQKVKYLEPDTEKFLVFILKERFFLVGIMLVLFITFLGKAAAYAAMVLYGAGAGMLFSTAAVQFGIKGFLLVVSSMFPQQLVLLPAWYFLALWCLEKQKGYRMVTLLWLMVLMAVGTALECYVNPKLLREVLTLY